MIQYLQLIIRTQVNPKVSQEQKIENLTNDKELQTKIATLIGKHKRDKELNKKGVILTPL